MERQGGARRQRAPSASPFARCTRARPLEIADTGGAFPLVCGKDNRAVCHHQRVGKGTGLRLSISYGIVQDCGGSIAVESAPGEGARFIIDLPVLHEAREGG